MPLEAHISESHQTVPEHKELSRCDISISSVLRSQTDEWVLLQELSRETRLGEVGGSRRWPYIIAGQEGGMAWDGCSRRGPHIIAEQKGVVGREFQRVAANYRWTRRRGSRGGPISSLDRGVAWGGVSRGGPISSLDPCHSSSNSRQVCRAARNSWKKLSSVSVNLTSLVINLPLLSDAISGAVLPIFLLLLLSLLLGL